jgi:hypothetical protein
MVGPHLESFGEDSNNKKSCLNFEILKKTHSTSALHTRKD